MIGSGRCDELAAQYLDQPARPKKKSAQTHESMLRRHILPILGTKKAEAATAADVAKLHHSLAAANRLLALLSVMFNLAESWGSRAPYSNPCRR